MIYKGGRCRFRELPSEESEPVKRRASEGLALDMVRGLVERGDLESGTGEGVRGGVKGAARRITREVIREALLAEGIGEKEIVQKIIEGLGATKVDRRIYKEALVGEWRDADWGERRKYLELAMGVLGINPRAEIKVEHEIEGIIRFPEKVEEGRVIDVECTEVKRDEEGEGMEIEAGGDRGLRKVSNGDDIEID
ncbi:hypothetical protein D6827_00615 [Candidatus Parcubacteria bacterium]|nr:MAG: hypothetical protein D6827_00615 [Candidatus Parcubacteria bacterium]